MLIKLDFTWKILRKNQRGAALPKQKNMFIYIYMYAITSK